MTRGRGRPKKEASPLSREVILSAAVKRLDGPQSRPLSLRLLARDLGVTPMALYSHVEGVDDILQGLAYRWFDDVPEMAATADNDALQEHLVWYCDRVLRHASLTLALVSRRGELPRPHETWTRQLRQIVTSVGLPREWSDILTDHLHGFTLSHLAGAANREHSLAEYERQIAILLQTVMPSHPPHRE